MKKLALVIVTIFTSFNIYAQDYFVVGKDTTFCKDLKYTTTVQGYLKTIKYTDLKEKEVLIDDKKNMPDVITFYSDKKFIDKTPLKADKPDGYIRYTERSVDGKLKIYLAQQGYKEGSGMHYTGAAKFTNSNSDWNTSGPTGIYRFYLKMPDGTYYKINDKGNIEKYIKPYLLKCAEFKNQYKGDYSTKEEPFMAMIKLYNSLCK